MDELVEQFAQNVIAQSEAIMDGNAQRGNRHARRYLAAFDSLCQEHGDEGRAALCTLFGHPRPDVRAKAAAFMLRYRTEQALAVLREVSSRPGLAGFGAGECIKRWEEGSWQLDPE